MGLFGNLLKKKEEFDWVNKGSLFMVLDLKKEYKNKEEIKLGKKRVLSEEERKELLKYVDENAGRIIFDFDFNAFQEIKFESNPILQFFIFLELNSYEYEAYFSNKMLKKFVLTSKDGESNLVTSQERLEIFQQKILEFYENSEKE